MSEFTTSQTEYVQIEPDLSKIAYTSSATTYHMRYCLCIVIGRSGNGTQVLFRCLFCSLSSANRILVASSLSTTEIPELICQPYPYYRR